jgi:hypothetical protein
MERTFENLVTTQRRQGNLTDIEVVVWVSIANATGQQFCQVTCALKVEALK